MKEEAMDRSPHRSRIPPGLLHVGLMGVLVALVLPIAQPAVAGAVKGSAAFDTRDCGWAYAKLWLEAEETSSSHIVSPMMAQNDYVENMVMGNKDGVEKLTDSSQDKVNEGVAYHKDEAIKYYKKGQYKNAREILEPLAADGDKDAQALLGVMYLKGQGVSSDTDKATYLLELAEQKGSVRVAMLLSRIYIEQGDEKGAREILAKYAYENPAVANMMAEMYRYGKGFTRDLGKARHWYQVAAESGYIPAKRALEKIGYPQSED